MTTQTQVQADLLAARELIADIDHWIQDLSACAEDGEEVSPTDADARQWCATGALLHACNANGDVYSGRYKAAELALTNAAKALFSASIIDVNDGNVDYYPEEVLDADDDGALYSFAHSAVLMVFDRAIATEEAANV